MKTRNVIIVITLILIVCVVAGAWYWRQPTKRKPKKISSGAPVCLLAGDLKNIRGADARPGGFENLGNMIRLHFEASSLEECQQAVYSYCQVRLLSGYAPGNMTMTYRTDPTGRFSQRFKVTAHCTLEKADPESP